MNDKELKIFREECYKSLAFFSRAYFKYYGMDYRETTYDKHFYDVIQNTLFNPDENRNLLINCPPRIGKSMRCRLAILWNILVSGGESNYIITSYSNTLALQHNTAIRDMLQSDFFKLLSTEIECNINEKSKELLGLSRSVNDRQVSVGGIRATSISGAVTGFGFGISKGAKGNGCLILDDPQKPEADTDNSLGEVITKFNSILRTRRNHPNAPMIVIQQRVHTNDLSGWLLAHEPDKWQHLCLPVMNENGELLDEQLYPMETIKQMRETDEVVFQSQYMQAPLHIDTATPFNMEKLKFYNDVPDLAGYQILLSADFATSDKSTGDYSSVFVVAKKGASIIVLDWFMEKLGVVDVVNKTCNMITKWNPLFITFEKGVIANAFTPMIQSQMTQLGKWINIDLYTRNRDKRAMATQLIHAWNNGYVQVPIGFDSRILQQFELFPNATHDDAVDGLSGAFLANNSLTNPVITDTTWEDEKWLTIEPDVETF